MRPARFIGRATEYEELRGAVNVALAFCGLSVGEDGQLSSIQPASTLSDAQRRAGELRAALNSRGVHTDVLSFCRQELLVDNYFHAVLEATKSVADKIRRRTGLDADGSDLVTQAFGGQNPRLKINGLQTASQRMEQRGFCNLLVGVFGMFRNPTAHEARVNWEISLEDASDLLSILSLAHRRIDTAESVDGA